MVTMSTWRVAMDYAPAGMTEKQIEQYALAVKKVFEQGYQSGDAAASMRAEMFDALSRDKGE